MLQTKNGLEFENVNVIDKVWVTHPKGGITLPTPKGLKQKKVVKFCFPKILFAKKNVVSQKYSSPQKIGF